MKSGIGPLLLVCCFLAACGENIEDIENVSFKADIQPILNDHCTLCHSSHTALGNINLESYEAMMASRYLNRKQPIALAGKPLESRLDLVVHSRNPAIRMPPPSADLNRLTEVEIAKIRIWIEEGAKNN